MFRGGPYGVPGVVHGVPQAAIPQPGQQQPGQYAGQQAPQQQQQQQQQRPASTNPYGQPQQQQYYPGTPGVPPNGTRPASAAPAPGYPPGGQPAPTGYPAPGAPGMPPAYSQQQQQPHNAQYQQQQQQQPQPGAAPSPVDQQQAAVGQQFASTRRRLYPEQITKAYQQSVPDADPFGAPSPSTSYSQLATGGAAPGYGQQQPQQQQQQQQPLAANQSFNQSMMSDPNNVSQQSIQQQPQPNTPMPLYPKASYGSTLSMNASIDGMANSFSHLGVGTPIMQPVINQAISLIGAPPAPHEIHAPPPLIRLSPQAACTMSPHSNCSPTYKRATINVVPQTAALLSKSKIPFALYIAPFRGPEPGEPEIPVINSNTIVRCRRCRTYINPYVQFLDRGQRWKCNLCYFPNDVPEAFDFDSATQSYIDRWQRPELNHAVVEYVAPSEYMLRPPQPPLYLFILDVSYAAIQCGMLHAACHIIKNSLDRIPNADNRTLVGFITVDSALHFYNLNANLSEPQMLVVGDLDDVFLPLPEDLLVNLTECKAQITSLLDKLPSMHQNTQNVGNALGPALQAAYQLASPIGGKIVVLQTSLPNLQAGALKPRDDKNRLDASLLQPTSPFYKQFAVDCSRTQVSVDMFLFAQGTGIDVATLCCAPRFTAGNTYLYPGWSAAKKDDAEKLAQELSHFLGRPIALEAVLRVRASRGLRMSVYHGNFFVRSTDLLALPNVNPDNTYAIEIAIDETIQSSVVCFQTALLHTTAFGERRIRVITLSLPVTTNLADIFHAADPGALVNLLARKAVERAVESKLEDARDAITNKCIDILGVYKTVQGNNATAATQLQCPVNLKLFPLLCLGLIKHPALRIHPLLTVDQRAAAMELLRVGQMEPILHQLHPAFYPLHRILLETQDLGTIVDGAVKLPPYPLPSTSERLERNGVYVLFDGVGMYLWVSRHADPTLLAGLFGSNIQSYDQVPSGPIVMQPTGHAYAERALNLINTWRARALQNSTIWPKVHVVKEDADPVLRMWTLGLLIEDRAEYAPSFPQFLAQLREKVAAYS
ncbi:COPII subunit [Allomyces arbusculus]|nr:COPII subunit [Allomyces arbusculus]